MGLLGTSAGLLLGLIFAPATGGTSVLLSTMAGGVAGHVAEKIRDDVKKDEALAQGRSEGHRDGYRQGQIDAAKKFAAFLEQDDNMKIGAFALGIHIAHLDGEFSEEEADVITEALGSPDSSLLKPHIRSAYKEIMDCNPDFETIQEDYLDGLTSEQIIAMDIFVKDVIEADDNVTDEEVAFFKNEWEPYVKYRR